MMQACRGNDDFAFLVSMLQVIVVDMMPFLFVLALAVGTVAFALRLLKHDEEEFGDAFTAACDISCVT